MRYLDTNIFIRFFTGDDGVKQAACLDLFRKMEQGEEDLLTSEAIVAEAVFVLCSRAHYGLPRQEATALLRPILQSRGLHLPAKQDVLRALDLFDQYSQLDFEDALSAAHMEAEGISEIYSFDRDFDRVEGVTRLEP